MLIAVDTGGTKTLVASFASNGSLLRSVRFPTPKDTRAYIVELVRAIHDIADSKPTIISIGLPGITENGIALYCPNLGWKNFAVCEALGKHFTVPIYLENDANLAGLAETHSLPSLPASSLYVTISTGIGTGVTLHGEINSGLRRSEGGHILLEYDGVVREWESFASGSAIYKAYRKYARDITSERTWQQIADRISRGLLAIIPLLQPEVVIVGGSIGTYFERYEAHLTELLDEKMPPYIARPALHKALHPEEAVIYGCYYYAVSRSA